MAQSAPRGDASIVDFLMLMGRLKGTPRTGWVLSGVPEPETIAAHMYRMAIASSLIHNDGRPLDRALITRISLAHDMAESLVGDVAPADKMDAAAKHTAEASAMQLMSTVLRQGGRGDAGNEFQRHFEIYEDGTTTEAQYVKDLDKLDMILQALEYEARNPALDLGGFFRSTAGRFRTPEIQSWASEVVRRRDSMLQLRASGAPDSAVSNAVFGNFPPLLRPPPPKLVPSRRQYSSFAVAASFSCGVLLAGVATLLLWKKSRWK